jgi:hypothetical protein
MVLADAQVLLPWFASLTFLLYFSLFLLQQLIIVSFASFPIPKQIKVIMTDSMFLTWTL